MADNDTVSDVEDVEQTGSTDIDEVLLLAFLAFGVVFILAIAFDYKSLAGLGVGEIGSFLSPVQAFFNGLASLITGFFYCCSPLMLVLESYNPHVFGSV